MSSPTGTPCLTAIVARAEELFVEAAHAGVEPFDRAMAERMLLVIGLARGQQALAADSVARLDILLGEASQELQMRPTGQDHKFRTWCEHRRVGYVVAVVRSQSIPLPLDPGFSLGSRRADAAQQAAIAGYILWTNRHARPKRRFAPESKIRRLDYLRRLPDAALAIAVQLKWP